MPRVLVNGPASWNTLIDLDSLPVAGGPTLAARGHRDGLGGTSAGKALTLAALGVDVTLRTVLGEDEAATAVRRALARERIEVLAVPAAAGRTERHLNLMTEDGRRQSIYLELPSPEHELGPRAAAALLAGTDVLVADLAEHSRPLLAAARPAGVPLWCDVHDDDGHAEYPRAFARAADVLLVSHARLTDPAAYLRAQVDAGCRLAVCTLGDAGSLALDASGWFEVSVAPAPRLVDTNGAGDAFFAGLLAATLNGRPTAEALAEAAATGALAVASAELGAPGADPVTVARLAAGVSVRRRPR
ncbi:carbohydrate kinase family protein [Actinotalea sp.]|uniref:carbohydrate kinase family protein n=1 Tax=Actinotalea sp. TaxID=1872145 RepID=UPI00356130B8